MPKNLLDLAIRRQVTLERLKAGQVQDFNGVFRAVASTVRKKFGQLDGELTGSTRKAFTSWMKSTEKEIRGIYAKQVKLFTPELEKVAGVYAAIEASDITASMFNPVNLRAASPRDAFKLAQRLPMPFNGEPFEDFIGKLAGNETDRVVNTMRRGFFQGRTNQELVREIIGTKAANYKDGILEVSRRNASTTVRTSIQHAANAGRNATWEANKDVVSQYEWVSTLDGRTSHQCKGLDGQKWDVGKGPTPPIHQNCRSTTVAILADEFKFLSEGRTRSSLDGPIPADNSYFDWLKTQDPAFQDLALGPTRAKLFRDGGLTPEQFRGLQLNKNFEPMTLAEMKALEPEAFEKAFGSKAAAPMTPPATTPAPVSNIPGVPAPSQRVRDIREKVANILNPEKLAELEKLEDSFRTLDEKWRVVGRFTPQEERDFFKTKVELLNLRNKLNLDAHLAISLPKNQRGNPASIATNASRLRVNKTKVLDATDFVSRVVPAKYTPQVKVRNMGGNRAKYTNWDQTIHIGKDSPLATVIHEIVHDIEYRYPEISSKTKAFRDYRGQGEKPRRMASIHPGAGYRWEEITLEDEWFKKGGSAYTGKIYDRAATEILTMGVQRLYESPVLFARQDPEFFEFILSVLQD